MRAMGIDFGLKRIGVAFSDETKFLATPFAVYHRKDNQADLNYLSNLITTNKVDEIVCGLPLNPKGEEGEIASETRAFMQQLTDQTKIQPVFVDERMTSVLAEEFLAKREKDWRKRKEKLDSVAASIILQDYLDHKPKK